MKIKKKKIKGLKRKYKELLKIFEGRQRIKLYDSEYSLSYLEDVQNAYKRIIKDLNELLEGVENE